MIESVVVDDLGLEELDLDAFAADPAAELDRLRPNRIVRSVRGYEVISYDLVAAFLADGRLQPMSAQDFAKASGSDYVAEWVDKGVFLFMPPERHGPIRRIFQRGFGGKQIKNHQEVMYGIATRLIDELLDRKEGDLVNDFTQQFAAESLCRLIGFPAEDIPQFLHAALDLRYQVFVPMAPHVPRIEAALDTLHAYTLPLIERRRRDPKEDFLSILIEMENVEGGLTTDEVIWGAVNLLLGGIDTTNFQLASTLLHLIRQREWDAAAADPEVRLAAIEESTRLTPISTMLSRKARVDVEVDDIVIPAGSDVRLNMVGAGRDPTKFVDPHTYRLDRSPPYFPIIFGNGPHACIGRALAVPELRIGTELITARLTDVALSAEPEMHSWTDAFYGPYTLPATFGRR